jgi:hypothetical protein
MYCGAAVYWSWAIFARVSSSVGETSVPIHFAKSE